MRGMALFALGAAAVLSAGCMGTRSTTASYRATRPAPTVMAYRAYDVVPPAPPVISYSRSDTHTGLYVPPPPPPPAWPGTTVTPVSRAPRALTRTAPAPSYELPRVEMPRAAPAPMRRSAPVRRAAPRRMPASSALGCLDGT